MFIQFLSDTDEVKLAVLRIFASFFKQLGYPQKMAILPMIKDFRYTESVNYAKGLINNERRRTVKKLYCSTQLRIVPEFSRIFLLDSIFIESSFQSNLNLLNLTFCVSGDSVQNKPNN